MKCQLAKLDFSICTKDYFADQNLSNEFKTQDLVQEKDLDQLQSQKETTAIKKKRTTSDVTGDETEHQDLGDQNQSESLEKGDKSSHDPDQSDMIASNSDCPVVDKLKTESDPLAETQKQERESGNYATVNKASMTYNPQTREVIMRGNFNPDAFPIAQSSARFARQASCTEPNDLGSQGGYTLIINNNKCQINTMKIGTDFAEQQGVPPFQQA